MAGDYAYVGVGLRLVILDISEPGALREVGSSEPFGYFVEDVTLSQEMVYVAAGGAGLYIVDVSNPALPIIVGNYDTAGYAEGVTVVGAYAYAADGPDGLRVFDITNPAQPAEVSAAYKLNYAFDVAVDAGYAFVAAAGAGLLVADVSDPLQPKEAGSLDTPGNAFGINLSGSVAYVADGWEGLRILDISTPPQPQEIGFYDTQGWALDVSVSGSIAYVAFAFNAIQILDVSAPRQPTVLGSFDMLGNHIGNLAIDDGVAYITSRDTGLSILDLTPPMEPVRIGIYNPMGFADAVAVSGSYAYVAAGPYGLRIVDIADLAHPREVGTYDTGGFNATGVVVVGDFAYVIATGLVASAPVEGQGGLHIIDVSNPANPTRASFLATPSLRAAMDIVIENGIAYIADERGLEIVDVSRPSSPTLLNAMDFPQVGALVEATWGVATSDDMAYVTHGHSGLKVVDVSDPQSPAFAGTYVSTSINKVIAVAVGGDFAYVVDHPRLHVINISDPKHPSEASFYDLPVTAERVTFADDRLYVADSSAGLVVLDVSDPTLPSLAGWRRLPGHAFGLTAGNNYVYVADGDGGLFIIEDTAKPAQASLNSATLSIEDFDGIEPVDNTPVQAMTFLTSPQIRPISITANWQAGSPIGSQQIGLLVPAIFQPGASTLTVTSPAGNGPGTLYWALENVTSGDTITFDPEVFPPQNPTIIYPSTELPQLQSGKVTIDASNAGVILDGSKSNPDSVGLIISSDNNIIKGLQIVNFRGGGMVIGGRDNIIGGDRRRGSSPLGEGNLISGNGWAGVNLKEPRATGNRIIGNHIGTDITGTRIFGHQMYGVQVALYASKNVIGGQMEWERNVISGNEEAEISLVVQANGNRVVGNYIGTNESGTTRLGNAVVSVLIEMGGFSNIVQANVIGGNGVLIADWGSWGNEIIGNFIGVDSTGNTPLEGSSNNGIGLGPPFTRIGGTKPGEGNIIGGNGMSGIAIGNTTDVFVIGNYVGMDWTGTRAIPNQGTGVSIFGTRHTFIGGTSESERNLISGNNRSGISLEGIGDDYNFIIGNSIGTDASGQIALPNHEGGVVIQGGDHNTIQSNLVAYNEKGGVHIALGNSNRAYHNSIILNNGFDNGSDNAWDDGSEGNYWSDYTGRDKDGNGIGNTPYNVAPNGVDNYPMMQPFLNHDSIQRTMTGTWPRKAHRHGTHRLTGGTQTRPHPARGRPGFHPAPRTMPAVEQNEQL